MPFELFRVAPGGTLIRHRSVMRRSALAGALHQAEEPTVGIDINDLSVAGVSPHLVEDDLVGLGFEEVSERLDPSYRRPTAPPDAVHIAPASVSLRMAGTAEFVGSMLIFGSILAVVVGTLVVADTALLRAEKTIAHLGVLIAAGTLVGLGVLLRSMAVLLRRGVVDS